MLNDKYNYFLIGERIRQLREQKKYTQTDLIEELKLKGHGISRNTLSDLENGNLKDIKISVLIDICNIFNCDFNYLLGENECKTREIQFINDYTGLDECVINFLHISYEELKEHRKNINENNFDIWEIKEFILYLQNHLIINKSLTEIVCDIFSLKDFKMPNNQFLDVPIEELKKAAVTKRFQYLVDDLFKEFEKSNEIDIQPIKRKKGGNKNSKHN